MAAVFRQLANFKETVIWRCSEASEQAGVLLYLL